MSASPPGRPAEHAAALLLWRCSSMRGLTQAHALLIKSGLAGGPRFHAALLTLSALRPWGCLAHARALLDATPADVPLFCDPIIRAYSSSIFPAEALRIYNLMCLRGLPLSNLTFPFLLKACGRAAAAATDADGNELTLSDFSYKGSEIHCRVFCLGFQSDEFVQNSLMFMYSLCGHLGYARKVFDELLDKTVVSWNVMLAAYERIGDSETVDRLFQSMPVKNVVSWNSMITRYLRAGHMSSASRVFHEMPERDAISWNSMIAGHCRAKNYIRALELFKEMQANRIKPTKLTIVSVLGACAESNSLEMGVKIHDFLTDNGYKIEGYVGNALLDMYAKCGNLRLARKLFDEMSLKHTTCWNTMIVASAVHGHCEEALVLFDSMERDAQHQAKPNRVTFLGVLIACSHNGLLKEGQAYFNRMMEEYKIQPDIKHYGCMVDLLSRCGLVEEAFQMIKQMPVGANAVLWKSVLSACRHRKDVKLAEVAFEELARLGPLTDADYVQMSNIYAEAERWEDVGKLRSGMICSSISKLPGRSQIDLA